MMTSKKGLVAAALAVGMLGATALPLSSYARGADDGAAASHQGAMDHGSMRHGAEHIDGRIAFLKAELKVTPAQEDSWKAVETVIRQQAAKRAELREDRAKDRAKSMTAVERLERGQSMAAQRSQSLAELIAVFKPFYAQLSDEQKQTADELFMRPPRSGHGMRHD